MSTRRRRIARLRRAARKVYSDHWDRKAVFHGAWKPSHPIFPHLKSILNIRGEL